MITRASASLGAPSLATRASTGSPPASTSRLVKGMSCWICTSPRRCAHAASDVPARTGRPRARRDEGGRRPADGRRPKRRRRRTMRTVGARVDAPEKPDLPRGPVAVRRVSPPLPDRPVDGVPQDEHVRAAPPPAGAGAEGEGPRDGVEVGVAPPRVSRRRVQFPDLGRAAEAVAEGVRRDGARRVVAGQVARAGRQREAERAERDVARGRLERPVGQHERGPRVGGRRPRARHVETVRAPLRLGERRLRREVPEARDSSPRNIRVAAAVTRLRGLSTSKAAASPRLVSPWTIYVEGRGDSSLRGLSASKAAASPRLVSRRRPRRRRDASTVLADVCRLGLPTSSKERAKPGSLRSAVYAFGTALGNPKRSDDASCEWRTTQPAPPFSARCNLFSYSR